LARRQNCRYLFRSVEFPCTRGPDCSRRLFEEPAYPKKMPQRSPRPPIINSAPHAVGEPRHIGGDDLVHDDCLEVSGHVAIRQDAGDLRGIPLEFNKALVVGSDLSGLTIRTAKTTIFSDCKFVGTIFEVGLVHVLLRDSRIEAASFRSSFLKRVKFERCTIGKCDFYLSDRRKCRCPGEHFKDWASIKQSSMLWISKAQGLR
jgi:hypothetical protein